MEVNNETLIDSNCKLTEKESIISSSVSTSNSNTKVELVDALSIDQIIEGIESKILVFIFR